MNRFFRPALLLASFLLLAAALAPATLRSQLFLAPAETFLLGGNQPGGFRLDAYNAGKAPVSLSQKLPGADWQPVGELYPLLRGSGVANSTSEPGTSYGYA